MVDVSVILPIYKVENYLKRCINNLLEQTHTNIEIILVNDGSPDGCKAICEEYRELDKRIKVIHQENQGAGAARNSGLEAAQGKYIYFCDPDDFIEANLIEDNFHFAEKYNANMVIFGHYNEIYTAKNHVSTQIAPETAFLESKEDFRNGFDQLFRLNIMYTLWNKLYRKSYLDMHNCRFSNQKIGEDTLFNYKVYEQLDRVFCNENYYYHYIVAREDSATNVFRENRFQLRYKETIQLEVLFHKWGYGQKFHQLILNDWATTLSHGISNLFYENCPYSIREKKKVLQEMISTAKIKPIIEGEAYKEIYSPILRIKVILLKNNQLVLALLMSKLKSITKKKFPIVKKMLA